MRNTRGNDNKLLAYSKWRGGCVRCPLNKSERHMTKIWKRCFDAKVEFRVGGSSSVVEDHDGSILCTEDGANFRSIDRSKVSIKEEGGRIYSSFWGEMRRFYWMVVRRVEGRWLFNIEKIFNTSSADRIAGESPFTFVFKSGSISGLWSDQRKKIKVQIEIWNSRIRATCFILILMKRGKWWRDMKKYIYIWNA